MAANIIRSFFTTTGRSSNDFNNRIRETILTYLHNPPLHYINDSEHGKTWRDISSKWNTVLGRICGRPYDDIRVKKMAGRRYNYDYNIDFLYNGIAVKTVKVEFKHNCNSIDKLPEYFNCPEKRRLIDKCYAEYFYDGYIDRICALSDRLVKPSKEVYMKHIYGSNYSKHKFFEELKSIEPIIQNEKKFIVQESIKNYLSEYGSTINLGFLTEDIKNRQSDKIFILWDLDDFKVDSFREDELVVEEFISVKNDNVVVVKSKCGTIHNLLLRWKNHLGILYPAWQISLQR